MKTARTALILAFGVVLASGCKKPTAEADRSGGGGAAANTAGSSGGGGGGGGGSGGENNGPSAAGTAGSGTPGKGCDLPSRIVADYTITKGCTLIVKETVRVDEGATLTIEQGVKLSWETDTYLWVDFGKLIVAGTEKEPVLFTSNNNSPAAGDWVGVGFAEKVGAGTSLDHLIVEYAGSKASSGDGAVHLDGMRAPGRVAITHSTFRKSAQFGLTSLENGNFAKFEGNSFAENKLGSMRVQASTLGSVGAGNKFVDPIHVVESHVTETQSWPPFDVPLVVEGRIQIAGDSTAPTLTIAPGTTVKMAQDVYLETGDQGGGALVAKNVTFTSASPTPADGDWVGIFIHSKSNGTTLDGCTFEYFGGTASGGDGALTLWSVSAKDLRNVTISNNTFRHGKIAAMKSDDHDCGAYAKAGNKVEGVPFCRKAD